MDEVIQTLRELRKCTSQDEVQTLKRKFGDQIRGEANAIEGIPSEKQEKEIDRLSRNSKWNTSEIQIVEAGESSVLALDRLKKCVEYRIGDVRELIHQGSFPEGITVEVLRKGDIIPTTKLAEESTARKMTEKICNCLMDKDVTKIGVYGMGGIGKTTVMKHINNYLLDDEIDNFDNVIWVTVSKAFDVIQLQENIACKLNLDLSRYEDETTRAAKLYGALQAMGRYVLILDDLWEAFLLEDIGIPEPTPQNECKLVLTTRSFNICRSMKCKAIQMVLLSKEEAWDLFLDFVGHDLLDIKNLEAVMKEVVKECSGLPLAVVTVARGMAGVKLACEWRNALKKLRENSNDSKGRKVIQQLKFSYERLRNKNLQDCLLYCALYPEDYRIERAVLIERLAEEGMIEGIQTIEEEFDEGNVMLDALMNACLLEDASFLGKKLVKMHDLVRDMALQITSITPRFMVRAGLELTKLPEEKNWPVELMKVSLMKNNI